MRDEGVTEDEVARAVALIQTELIVSLQSAGDRADKLSLFATYFGDPSLVNEQADRYRAVTVGAGQCVRARAAGCRESRQPALRAARQRQSTRRRERARGWPSAQ